MYFNDKKNSTNIDHEFKQEKNVLRDIINFISKYKMIFIIGIVVIVLLIVMLLLFTNKNSDNYLILSGDEVVTIYQGDSYVEPGYKAYNSKYTDLTNDVQLESDLNTGVIGEYEIVYKLGNISKVRYVKVIEKPQDYVFMSLTPVNNKVDIYLKKGDKYIEPGYSAFSTSGIDLTDKVTIDGKVDTSRKGTYTLTYSVVDENGVKISKVRKVIVMDSELSLTLNNDNYTNQEVVINAYVIDEYFNYMILPNNEEVTVNNYSYKVSSNGTYKFKVYDKKGNSKESSIKVNNIDKEVPSGSCSGSYKDGVSSINVNAMDNIGIASYVINGKSYTSKNITINSELKTVNVAINDKAGNSKSVSCTLKNNNKNPLDDIYTSSNSHTNSINGIKYLLYNQADPKWASYEYPQYNSNIGEMGCHITSAAVVASAYNHNITPLTVYNGYSGSYPYHSVNQLADEGFDCEFVSAVDSKQKILTSLSKGNVVVIMAYGKNKGGTNPFTSSQHYMALIDYQNDKIFIGNSYSDSGNGRSGWYEKDSVLTSIKEVNICTPTQKLIDKFKNE